jgi:1-acyl-sn-glycerol-3-phosphate acyltransferase
MFTLLHLLVNVIFLCHLIVLTAIFEFLFTLIAPLYRFFGKIPLDEIYRYHNWAYGNFLVRLSWPYLRIRINGIEHIRKRGPFIIVLNHKSFADIFFSSLVPVPNQVVVARKWVFDLLPFGWAMKKAQYVCIEKMPFNSLLSMVKQYSKRNASFQFYPEAHRSKDGRLQRFHLGAFILAAEADLPVLPVYMVGTDKTAGRKFPFLAPGLITINMMKPVHPSRFEKSERAVLLRDHVYNLFKEKYENEHNKSNR